MNSVYESYKIYQLNSKQKLLKNSQNSTHDLHHAQEMIRMNLCKCIDINKIMVIMNWFCFFLLRKCLYYSGNSTSVVFFLELILKFTSLCSYLFKNHRYFIVLIPQLCAHRVEYSTNFCTGVFTQNKKIPQFKQWSWTSKLIMWVYLERKFHLQKLYKEKIMVFWILN